MKAIQPSFSKGEIAETLFGRVDTAAYQVAVAKAENVYVHAAGGLSNRAGLRFKGICANNSITSRLRKFQFKATDTYLLEFGDLTMRVMREGRFVLDEAIGVDSVTPEAPILLTLDAAHGWAVGDRLYLDGLAGAEVLNGRYYNAGPGTTGDVVALYDAVTGQAVSGDTLTTPYVTGGILSRVYTLTTPYLAADLFQLKFSQSADVMTITHRSYEERRLTRSGHAAWALTIPTYAPSIDIPTGFTGAGHSGYTGSDLAYYKLTATNAAQEESLAAEYTISDSASPPYDNTNYLRNDLEWDAVTGAVKYSIYRAKGGIYGLIGESTTLDFFDDNMAPDTSATPPEARTPLAGTGNYPGASAYYEQRQVFGGSTNNPDTSYYTRTGNYDSFSVYSPTQADDAITATLTSGEVNEIRHFVPGNDLLIMTGGAEWRVNAGTDSAFASTSIRQKPQSGWGSSHIAPMIVGSTVLFVQENEIAIRSLGFSIQADGYVGADMTKLAPHLFGEYKITDTAFLRSPEPIVLTVRSDGQACLMTFDQEQEVIGWARWKTAGTFEAVATVRETATDPDDTIYFVVKRTIGGSVVRFIEGIASRRLTDVHDSFFLDCGITHDEPYSIQAVNPGADVILQVNGHPFVTGDEVDISGIVWVPTVDPDTDAETQPDQLNGGRYTITVLDSTYIQIPELDGYGWNVYDYGGEVRKPVSTVTGLWHLEGRTVGILADANVVTPQVVSGGLITLPRPASRVHVGLRYAAEVVTLSPEIPRVGVIQGKDRKVPQVTVKFSKSRGLFYGTDPDHLDELKQREYEPYGEPTDWYSGNIRVNVSSNWERETHLILRQKYPLPMTILSVVYDVEGIP